MTQEEKKELLAGLFQGANLEHAQINVVVESGAKVCYRESPASQEPTQVDTTTLVECVDRVRRFFWSDSAMAVIFCVCRDFFRYANNMSQFEREFHCNEGLLSSTFRNNSYMRLPVKKWAENGAKDRVLRLAEAYRTAVEELLPANKPT